MGNQAEYYYHLIILFLMYGISAQGFNVTFGTGGLFNLAHVACYALGAYASALCSTILPPMEGASPETAADYLAIPLWWIINSFPASTHDTVLIIISIIASIIVSGGMALLLGAISLRLTHDYFAIGTLAYSFVVSAFLINWKSLTRGVLGIPGIPRPTIAGYSLQENLDFLKGLLMIFVVVQIGYYFILHGSFSRRLRAQSESEPVSLALGIPTVRTRLWGFIASAVGAGLAGSIFAFYINYIDPTSFSLAEMIFVLTIVVVGRPGSFWGVLISTAFLIALPEFISRIEWINSRPHILGPMRQLVYALILYAVVMFNKKNLFPAPREV
jgi:branched-chain amino acid transport system permease protein